MSRTSPGREAMLAAGAGVLELLLYLPALLAAHAYMLHAPAWPLLVLVLTACYGAGCWASRYVRLRRVYSLLLFVVPLGAALAWLCFPHRPLGLIVGGVLCMVALYRGARLEGASWQDRFGPGAYLSGVALYFVASFLFSHLPPLGLYAPLLLWTGLLALVLALLALNRLMLQREAAVGSQEQLPRGVQLQNRLQLGLLLLAALALALLPLLDRALAWLREQLARLLSGLGTSEPSEEPLPSQQQMPPIFAEGPREPSALLQLLERLAGYVMAAVLVALALWALNKLIRRLPGVGARLRDWLGQLMARGTDGEEKGYIDEVAAVRERELHPQAQHRPRKAAANGWRDDMSARDKVRYLYAFWLRKQQQRGYTPQGQLTPRETVEDLVRQHPEELADAERLLRLYEPARYGGAEAEADEIRRVKAALDKRK